MRHTQLAAWRNLAGWLGTLCLFLVLACLIDGSQAGGRKDPNVNEILAGQEIKISGPMPRDAETLEHLLLRSDEPALGLRLEETFSGFWMGGQLWRAEVRIPRDLPPGDYAVSLSARNETSPKHTQFFTMRVFRDQKALDGSSLSVVTSRLGLSPFVLAALLLPVGIAFGVLSTLLSRRLARTLRGLGLGQLFRLQRTEEGGLRVFYTLGAQDGLAATDTVEILDPRGERVLFTLPVATLRATDADSLLPEGARAPISALVRRARAS